MIKDCAGGKSAVVIACQSGISHSTVATILKNRNKEMETLTGSASSKAMKLTGIQQGPMLDMDKFLMT